MNNEIKFYATMLGTIFLFGGAVYSLVEEIFRGWTHISMFILAGIVSCFIALINDGFYDMDTDFSIQVITSTIICTIAEGICGIIVNNIMGLNVWCYDGLPFTFFAGQCNLLFCFAWLGISTFALPLLDHIEYLYFNGERPYYKLFGRVIFMHKEKKEK